MDQTRLPAALRGDKRALSPAALEQITALNGTRPLAFVWQVVCAGGVILGAMAWAVHMNAVWASVVAIVVIATRQNVLGLLVHDSVDCAALQISFTRRRWPGIATAREGLRRSPAEPTWRKRGIAWAQP